MKKKFLFLGAFFMLMVVSTGSTTAEMKTTMKKSVKLNSGYEMPILGLGTWTLTGSVCENAVYSAIKDGYRLIDTAKYYGNEREVGIGITKAVKDGLCSREEIFITTKIVPWSSNPKSDIEDSLKKLGVNYIDLCLLHQSSGSASDDRVYRAMIDAQKQGKIRSIGISNFYTENSVRRFFDFEIKPAVVQNENHIFNQEEDLKSFCQKNNIYIESYYPFGGRGNTKESLENPVIKKIAARHKKTSAQIIVRWHLQSGFIAIPGSSNPSHILENFGVWDFELSDEEMKEIKALDKKRRYENW